MVMSEVAQLSSVSGASMASGGQIGHHLIILIPIFKILTKIYPFVSAFILQFSHYISIEMA